MHRQPTTAKLRRGGDRMMEAYLERGNQLHNRAIVDFFARMVSIAMLSIRIVFRPAGKIQGDNAGGAGCSIKQPSRIPG